ncbi:MAG: nucleotidyltransferase family protein [Chloroflexi bacterium HGW-Chloroflexi-1]|nr:MAG: nucleotidyltransferase family protein [Chloroflexi bacterium HGW-Chloroflexi-1]
MLSAIVVAAGLSRRMRHFKLLLPWGQRTVIGQVVATLTTAGLAEIIVVTGHRAGQVADVLTPTTARTVFNPDYTNGEMLGSVQVGLQALGEDVQAALLCLGDQPQMAVETVRAVLAEGKAHGWKRVIIPSYQMHAGHPILLPRAVWPPILAASGTLRDVLRARKEQIVYVSVDTPTILADLDRPEDYTPGAA